MVPMRNWLFEYYRPTILIFCALACSSVYAQFSLDPTRLLNSNGNADSGSDSSASVETDGAGLWLAVWASAENLGGAGTDADIFIASSTNNGHDWSTPALFNTNATSDFGSDGGPQLATDGAGNWVVVWGSQENLNGTAGTDVDIFVATSANNGASWSSPALLNDNGNSDAGDDILPDIATNTTGNWVVTWESDEDLGAAADTDFDIFVATSANNGASWSSPALLNDNGASDIGTDQWSKISTDGAGNWVAMWHSNEDLNTTAGTDNDIFVSTSANNGASWTSTVLLNSTGTADIADDEHPQVTTDIPGTWIAVWHSSHNLAGSGGDFDIFFATSVNQGGSWSAPGLLNTNATTDIGSEIRPDIAADSSGNVVVVYRSNENLNGTAGTDIDMFYSTSSNSGASWDPPALLNTNGTIDGGANDLDVHIATDGNERWVAVWDSNANLNGTAGTDSDIFVAPLRFPPLVPAPAATPFLLTALAFIMAAAGMRYVKRRNRA